MSDYTYADLRALAEAATPGPWVCEYIDEDGYGWTVGSGDAGVVTTVGDVDACEDDAAWIAAANPARILALLADLAEARAEVARLTHLLGSHADGHLCTCIELHPESPWSGPADWEQDPWCPTHPNMTIITAERDALAAKVEVLTAEVENWEEWSNSVAERLDPWMRDGDEAQEALIDDALGRLLADLDAARAEVERLTDSQLLREDYSDVVSERNTYRVALARIVSEFGDYDSLLQSRAICDDRIAKLRAERARVEAVRALHQPMRIYDECDHPHQDGDPGVIDTGEFLTCEEEYRYSICRLCCVENPEWPEQAEWCADKHDHVRDGYCATIRALDGTP